MSSKDQILVLCIYVMVVGLVFFLGGGTPDNASGGDSNCLACAWDPSNPPGLPCPALM